MRSPNISEWSTRAWKQQIRCAAMRGLRRGLLLSGLSLLIGVFFLVLFIGPDVNGVARSFFSEARGWLPMCALSVVMVGLSAAGFQFSFAHYRRLLSALELGTPTWTSARFVDLTRDETIRFEVWFEQEENTFGATLCSGVWQRSPSNLEPPCGQSISALALLDPQTETPLVVTLGESTYIFDYPASPAN
jgi:hypothetical protein